MGNCCSNDTQTDNEQNMNLKMKSRRDLNKISVYSIIKMQALIRGFLTRRVIKKIYGFEMS